MKKSSLKFSPKLKIFEIVNILKSPILAIVDLINKYPDLFNVKFLKLNGIVIHKPEFIKYILQENAKNYKKGLRYDVLKPILGNGLLLSEGDFWKKQRHLTQPAFHLKKLQYITDITTNSTKEIIKTWSDNAVIDFADSMGSLTIEIVTKALFGANVSDRVEGVRKSIDLLNGTASFLARLPLENFKWTSKIFKIKKLKRAKEYLDNTIYTIINDRKKSSENHHDLLSMFMDVKNEETKQGMSDVELKDEMITLFIAGHETTVISLSWTIYLLSQHQDSIQKIRDELNEFIVGDYPTFEELPKLKFLTNVINESMRLYPPVFFIARTSLIEDNLGGYYISKNQNIGINIFGMHRHPDYWVEPNSFLPERFNNFDLKGDNRFVFLPFGGGPRICIGNNFAIMEMQIILCGILKNFDIELVSKTPKVTPYLTLKPSPSIKIRIKKR
ncbi:MAG: cytochrome P450 [Solirubrobacteraceae bacterium]